MTHCDEPARERGARVKRVCVDAQSAVLNEGNIPITTKINNNNYDNIIILMLCVVVSSACPNFNGQQNYTYTAGAGTSCACTKTEELVHIIVVVRRTYKRVYMYNCIYV